MILFIENKNAKLFSMYFGKQCTEVLQIFIANNIATNIEYIILFQHFRLCVVIFSRCCYVHRY